LFDLRVVTLQNRFFFANKSAWKKKKVFRRKVKTLAKHKEEHFFFINMNFYFLNKKNSTFFPMVFTTPKTKQSLKRLGPKPQAYIEKTCENTKKSTTNNIFRLKDQGQAINSFLLVC